MSQLTLPVSLPDVLARLERPLRTWSMIATVFGDVVVPRGGTLWLGTLLDIMAAFGIEAGGVRTAVSRLVTDGWLERHREGRLSFYALTPSALAETHAAGQRIYRPAREAWSGTWTIALLGEGDRPADRRALAKSGAGQLAPNVMIWPAARMLGAGDAAQVFTATLAGGMSDIETARRAWRLEELEIGYNRLQDLLASIANLLAEPEKIDGRTWLAIRLLVAHEYRRVALRDPGLPIELLGPGWPGLEARALVRRIWMTAYGPSEAWLMAHGKGADGPLPEAAPGAGDRFMG
jgi:phenylacetic acid degradation operon negative regulatory protein